jgi:aquaporin Z
MTVLNPNSASLAAPLAIGSALAVMVYAGGHVSGGHYNPAVSFAVFIRGQLPLVEMIKYWIVQLVGAIVAALLVLYLKGHGAPTALDMDVGKALLSEFLFTFALCFVVLNVATARATAGNSYYGFAIGFTVLVGAYAVGAISSGAFNPAVALGIAMMNLCTFSKLWIYIVANLLGGLVAALCFKGAHPKE